jgi:hypothetical protein
MATKKPTPRLRGDSAKDQVHDVRALITTIEKLSPDQQRRVDALLPEAEFVIEGVEDRMVALATAATKRWDPDANLHDADEDGPPVLDLDDFLETIDEIGECAMIRAVAKFMGLPEAVVDPILSEKLRSAYVTLPPPPPVKRNEQGFTVRRARRD